MNNESRIGNFSIGEVLELEEKMRDITTFIPDNQMGYVWSAYQRILNTTEPQPCGCRSASGLWIKAVDTIKQFLKENAGK
jgi:hypothetical protein